jgi:hypothetical protein
MHRIILRFIKKFSYERVRGYISIIFALVICLIFILSQPEKKDELIDVGVFSAIIGVFVLNFISFLLYNCILNKIEDCQKLTTDYDELTKMYCKSDLLTYSNKKMYEGKNPDIKESEVLYKFPVYVYGYLEGKKIDIKDSQNMYHLPSMLDENFDYLLSAHDTSTIYNQLNVRVDDWFVQEKNFVINTSRTTYFNSLVTNRALDYKMRNGSSVRDFYCYGPFAPELKKSKLSNHLGFNGFIESEDGYIPFVQRGKHVSIGKNTLGTSVSASLKTKYALDEEKTFSIEGLKEAIKNEIEDELKIKPAELEKIKLSKCIISAYQDLVEGGKPQLLFYVKSTLKKSEISARFKNETKRYKKENSDITYKESKSLEDGNGLVWIKKGDLKNLFITPGYVICSGEKYKMLPSTSASIVMLIKSERI